MLGWNGYGKHRIGLKYKQDLFLNPVINMEPISNLIISCIYFSSLFEKAHEIEKGVQIWIGTIHKRDRRSF